MTKATHLIPPGAVEEQLDLDGGTVRLLRSAADHPAGRFPLLLVHGGGFDNAAISWFHAFAAWGAEREVIAFDLPGFGYTTLDPLGPPAVMADFTVRVAEAVGISRAVIVGVSMGGDVTLNLGLRHPDLVAGLVLVAPGGLSAGFDNSVVQWSAWAAAQLPDAVLVPLAGLASRFTRQAMKAMVHDIGDLPEQVRSEFVREARRPRAGMGYARYNQATLERRGMRNNVLPLVHRIGAPTLFFHGAQDPLVSPENSRAAAERMPDARLVLVPDCGHWAQLEASDRFAAEVDAFLAGLDG